MRGKVELDKEEGEEIDRELQLLVIQERTMKDFKKSERTMIKKEEGEEVANLEEEEEEKEEVIEVEEKIEEVEIEAIRVENS